ncbi:WhiB family transcriptional regulator [Streptomyces sp. NPDC039022]|uniref:WhiB family transcriptional regulator n=1 Tax=unclassified Streptomyces TaxID=2593676 RepID=UPI0033D39392
MPERPRPACADEDPELFFPIGNTGPALIQIEEAKAVCHRCPRLLRERCLQDALEGNESGVWGGTDEDDRHRMRQRAA